MNAVQPELLVQSHARIVGARTGGAAISDRGLPFVLPQDPERATTGRKRHGA